MQAIRLWRRWSHVGRRPVILDESVTINTVPSTGARVAPFGQTAVASMAQIVGPLGSVSMPLHQGLNIQICPGVVERERILKVDIDTAKYEKMSKYCQKFVRSMWGTTASLFRQHVEGVTEGFQVPLRLVGVGYKAAVEGRTLNLKVGHTHNIPVRIPAGIQASCPIPAKIILSGTNLQQLTQLAAKIRSYRKPEPYNGRGIFVGNETIVLKEGKKK